MNFTYLNVYGYNEFYLPFQTKQINIFGAAIFVFSRLEIGDFMDVAIRAPVEERGIRGGDRRPPLRRLGVGGGDRGYRSRPY